MTNTDPLQKIGAPSAKTFVVQRTVVLHDVQEFIVTNVHDEFEAQKYAEAMNASYSSKKQSTPPNVDQIRCEIVDPGECDFWCVEEKQG